MPPLRSFGTNKDLSVDEKFSNGPPAVIMFNTTIPNIFQAGNGVFPK